MISSPKEDDSRATTPAARGGGDSVVPPAGETAPADETERAAPPGTAQSPTQGPHLAAPTAAPQDQPQAPDSNPSTRGTPSTDSAAAAASLPPAASGLAEKTLDLEALHKAVVEAAGVSGRLWLTLLFVLFYLLIAVGGVTHQDLFFEKPARLPFLGVDLPLKAFFWVGPALFFIIHAYVLLHLAVLASRVGVFNEALQVLVVDDHLRTQLRRQLPTNIFVQLLAGPREVRYGFMGLTIELIARVSVVVGPLALLLLFELQFLPYHDAPVTWWHRVAVMADLALLWTFWPAVARGKPLREARAAMPPGTMVVLVAASLIVILLLAIATFPGEWLDEAISITPLRVPRRVLVAGVLDLRSRKLRSLWANVLLLPGVHQIEQGRPGLGDQLEGPAEAASLRGRHLEGAVLIGAILPRADFTAASLQDARLEFADLRGAFFGLPGPLRYDPYAFGANLQGAYLGDAQLQGADLSGARLQGAQLLHTQLTGADLYRAQLQGARLIATQLQAADLSRADLRGTYLGSTDLRGADLTQANLSGAYFRDAELQGASLRMASAATTVFASPFVWHATPPDRLGEISLAGIELAAKYRSLLALTGEQPRSPALADDDRCSEDGVCEWSMASFVRLRQLIADQVPHGKVRDEALRRITDLDPRQPTSRWGLSRSKWLSLKAAQPSLTEEAYRARLVRTACAADEGGFYLMRGAYYQLWPNVPEKLNEMFLDEKRCPSARRLSNTEKIAFRWMNPWELGRLVH